MTVYNKHIRRIDDKSVALKVRITSCSTTGELTINDTKVTVNIDGTKNTFDLSTTALDTLGEFADGLNAINGCEAVIVDGLRSMDIKSDKMDMIGAAGTLTGDETLGATSSAVSFGWDSSANHQWIVSVQEEDLPSLAGVGGNKSRAQVTDDVIENLVYFIAAKANDTNGTNTLNIYRCVGTTETLVKTITGTATSSAQTLFDVEDDGGIPLSGGDPETGGRLVCIFTTDTTSTSGWIEVQGQSVNKARQALC